MFPVDIPCSPRTRRRRFESGSSRTFTLLEILVATGILVILGGALMAILRGGLTTWRRAEARRESFDQAQAILLQLREDFTCARAPARTPLRGLGDTEARLLCEPPPTKLFLVRSIKAESEHPITGHAGNVIGADAVIDMRDDLAEARASRLRATGGAMEVAWVLGDDGVLYRGVRAPIGPPRSLFDVDGWELAPPLPAGAVPAAAAPAPDAQGGGEAPAASSGSDEPLPALLRPFATGVIHFEVLFWTQYTTSWSTDHPPVRPSGTDEPSGPLPYWDSTRAILQPTDLRPREFTTFRSRGSLDDPRDDVLPVKVKVVLTLEEPPAARTMTFLAETFDARADSFRVQDGTRLDPEGGWVRVGKEWIRYDEVRGDTVYVARGGRGGRGTQATDHGAEDLVVVGRTFTTILELPAYREDWGDDPSWRNP